MDSEDSLIHIMDASEESTEEDQEVQKAFWAEFQYRHENIGLASHTATVCTLLRAVRQEHEMFHSELEQLPLNLTVMITANNFRNYKLTSDLWLHHGYRQNVHSQSQTARSLKEYWNWKWMRKMILILATAWTSLLESNPDEIARGDWC